jgi:phospholipase/carboxylesterase
VVSLPLYQAGGLERALSSSALSILSDLVDRLVAGGLPRDRIALLGFSQGACLTLEFAVRHADRLGAVIGLSAA